MTARPRLTYANVVSTLALIVAMTTGGAYAATQIQTAQIADEAVTSRKVADEAVKTRKVADGAVTAPKIAAGAVTGSRIAPDAITGSKLKAGAVTTDKVPADELTGDDIENNSVFGHDIHDGSVAEQDLQVGAARPRGFALVHGVVPAENFVGHNLTSDMVTHQATGVDCWELPFTPTNVAVSSWISYGGPTLVSAGLGYNEPCSEETDVIVYRYHVDTMNLYDGSYSIQIW